MYSLEVIKLKIIKEINQALGQKIVKPDDLVYPPDIELGDLSLSCFALAKKLSQAPHEIAKTLASQLKDSQADGPYLNFTINKQDLLASVLPEINDDYGLGLVGKNKKVMIEYSNVNTHKEYHLGHLRNIAYGDAVSRLLAANGYDAIPVTYINDFGIHVAKTLWAWKKRILADSEDKGYLLGQTYVQAVKELTDNEAGRLEVFEMMKSIESRQGDDFKLWQETRQWSLDYFQSVYQKLKIKFKRSYYESEQITAGLKLVDELLAKDILTKSRGAVIADLEKYNLGVLVIIRSDGTALYPVADLALAEIKFKEKLFKSIYVVDKRQSLYFKQLFKILELMGHQEKMIHLAYDFVKLPSGMMSARSGQIVTFRELYDKLMAKMTEETKSRHQSWTEDKVIAIAQDMAVGVLKFEMIKVSANKIITFNINEALRFDGFTSVYLQYTAARINSILRQAKLLKNIDYSQLTEKIEHELGWLLAQYPEVVVQAGDNYEPAEVAKYLFNLARTFNDYYHQISVLKADENIKQARLALLQSVKQVLSNGLDLLGIAMVEEM